MASLSVHIENVHQPKSPGETVKGRIEVLIPSISARNISATLVGEERSCIYDGDSYCRDSRCFLDVPIALDDPLDVSVPRGKLVPGMYRMHFEVKLPEMQLHSSTSFLPSESCAIAYCVKARVTGSGAVSDCHTKTDFQVLDFAAILVQSIPFFCEPTAKRITAFCCQNQGCIMIGARISDTLLDKSNVVEVYVSARNFSTARIVRAWLSLNENIRWQAGGNWSQRSVCLNRVAINLSPGLQPTTPRKLQSPTELEAEIRGEIESSTHCLQLLIPESAKNDFKGELIQCDHMIRISLETHVWSTNVKVEIPVQIGFWARKDG